MYTTNLKVLVLKLNPYKKCVKNNVTNGRQFTVGWLVDDNKFSHVDDNVNTTTVEIITKKFEKLARTTGKKHTFLGINIEFLGSGNVAITTP